MIRRREVTVTWNWGHGELPPVTVKDGERTAVITDGENPYALVNLEMRDGVLVITPRCMMIAGDPEALRRWADILDSA